MRHVGQMHRAAFAMKHAVGAAEQLAHRRRHGRTTRERVRVAAIRAERVVVLTHGDGKAGRNRLLSEGQVARALDQVLQEEVIRALLEIAQLDHELIEAEPSLVTGTCTLSPLGSNQCGPSLSPLCAQGWGVGPEPARLLNTGSRSSAVPQGTE